MGIGAAAVTADEDLISNVECARRLRLSPGRLSQMTAPGQKLAEAMTERGKMRWSAVCRLMQDRADPAKARAILPSVKPDEKPAVYSLTEDDRTFKRARARKMEADADTAEAARQQQLGALISRSAAEAEMFSRERTLRDQLLAIPATIASELAAEADPRAVRALLTRRLRQVLAEFTAACALDLEGEDESHV